jgi:putative Ca2+/H+ antiporter (TMEM165/GDT1 family)
MSEFESTTILDSVSVDETNLVLAGLLVPILVPVLIFLVEAQNITFRQLLRSYKRRKPIAAILGYFISMTILSSVAALLGYILRLIFPYRVLCWLSAIFFIAAGLIAALRSNILWNKKKSKHEKPLLSNHGFAKNLVKCIWAPLKVLPVEITHKVVLFLAAIGSPKGVVISAIVSYAVLIGVAGLFGIKLKNEGVKKGISIAGGVALISWGAVIYFFY